MQVVYNYVASYVMYITIQHILIGRQNPKCMCVIESSSVYPVNGLDKSVFFFL